MKILNKIENDKLIFYHLSQSITDDIITLPTDSDFFILGLSINQPGSFSISNCINQVSNNTLFLIPSAENTDFSCAQHSNCEIYLLYIRYTSLSDTDIATWLQPILDFCRNKNGYQTFKNPKFLCYFNQFDYYCTKDITDDQNKLLFLIRKTLVEVYSSVPKLVVKRPDFSLSEGIKNYINSNVTRPISLDEMENHFFISKYHLCHVFRRDVNMAIVQYAQQCKILKAKEDIEKGTPATKVALQYGFRNYSSFYRAYCQIIGNAPSSDLQKNITSL